MRPAYGPRPPTIIPTRGARTASAKSSVNRPAPVSVIGLLICNTFPPKLRPAIFRFNTKHAPRLSPSPHPTRSMRVRDAEAIAEAVQRPTGKVWCRCARRRPISRAQIHPRCRHEWSISSLSWSGTGIDWTSASQRCQLRSNCLRKSVLYRTAEPYILALPLLVAT